MTKVTRQPVFDLVKAIAIYLVVLGHTIQHYSRLMKMEKKFLRTGLKDMM